MSYDPVEVLATFAAEHGIGYPLLSDATSRVIRELDLENPQVEEQNRHFGLKTDERHQGLPYPGVFHISRSGVITSKRFEQSHRVRPSATMLLESALKTTPPAVADRVETGGVALEASLHTDTYHAQQIYPLRIRLAIPAGEHAYVGSVPTGFVPLSVELGGPASLEYEPPSLPAGTPLQLEGIDWTFEVIDGLVEITVPFRIDAEDEGDVRLEVGVALQTCNDRECFPPVETTLQLPLHDGGILRRR